MVRPSGTRILTSHRVWKELSSHSICNSLRHCVPDWDDVQVATLKVESCFGNLKTSLRTRERNCIEATVSKQLYRSNCIEATVSTQLYRSNYTEATVSKRLYRRIYIEANVSKQLFLSHCIEACKHLKPCNEQKNWRGGQGVERRGDWSAITDDGEWQN